MKKILAGLAVVLVLGGFARLAVGAGGTVLSPTQVTFTNFIGEADAYLPAQYIRGSTVCLTNCVIYQGLNVASGIQTLTNVTVVARVGAPGYTSTIYTGTVQSASAGTWGIPSITLSTNVYINIEIRLTDENNTTVIIPGWKLLNLRTSL